jgi:hypothetical protein
MITADNERSINQSINTTGIDGQDKLLVKVDREDVIRRLSWKVKRSMTFLIIYILVIMANIFILIWETTGKASYSVTITLESIINLVFLLEITVEIITQDRYFRQCWNITDFTICMLCIISFIVFCIYDSVSGTASSTFYAFTFESLLEKDDDDKPKFGDREAVPLEISDLNMVLLLTRYIVQSIRLCRFMVTAAKRNSSKVLEKDVRFTDNQTEDYSITKDHKEYSNYEVITPS